MAQSISLLNGGVAVVISPAKVREMANSPSGPVVRDMLVRGERVKLKARSEAPFVTGNLRNHIVKRLATVGGSTACIVGVESSSVPYAFWVHEGRGPVTGRPWLVFMGSEGHLVRVHQVAAAKPNRFLIRALTAAR